MLSRLRPLVLALVVLAAGGGVVGTAGSQAWAASPLTVSPRQVADGGTFTVSGTGCLPQGSGPRRVEVEVRSGYTAQVVLTGAVDPVPADGSWSVRLTMPREYQSAPYPVGATCGRGGESLVYDWSEVVVREVTPTLSLSRSAVAPGETLTAVGADFFPRQQVTVRLIQSGYTDRAVATITTDRNGRFSSGVTIPASSAEADSLLVFYGADSRRQVGKPVEVAEKFRQAPAAAPATSKPAASSTPAAAAKPSAAAKPAASTPAASTAPAEPDASPSVAGAGRSLAPSPTSAASASPGRSVPTTSASPPVGSSSPSAVSASASGSALPSRVDASVVAARTDPGGTSGLTFALLAGGVLTLALVGTGLGVARRRHRA